MIELSPERQEHTKAAFAALVRELRPENAGELAAMLESVAAASLGFVVLIAGREYGARAIVTAGEFMVRAANGTLEVMKPELADLLDEIRGVK